MTSHNLTNLFSIFNECMGLLSLECAYYIPGFVEWLVHSSSSRESPAQAATSVTPSPVAWHVPQPHAMLYYCHAKPNIQTREKANRDTGTYE